MPNRAYTTVRTEYRQGVRNYALIAGGPVAWKDVKRSVEVTIRVAYFAPGARFALSLWERNEFGTTAWRTLILEAVRPGEIASRVQSVRPGARVLLDVAVPMRARVAHRWIAANLSEVMTSKSADLVKLDATLRCASATRLRAMLARCIA